MIRAGEAAESEWTRRRSKDQQGQQRVGETCREFL